MRNWIDEGVDPDEQEMSNDELDELYQINAMWEEVHIQWVTAGRKCVCGQPISLSDAYYVGRCEVCRLPAEHCRENH